MSRGKTCKVEMECQKEIITWKAWKKLSFFPFSIKKMMNAKFRHYSYFVGNVNQFCCVSPERQIHFRFFFCVGIPTLFFPSHKSWKWIRRKFEELYAWCVVYISYHHQKGTDMAIRSGEEKKKKEDSHFYSFILVFFKGIPTTLMISSLRLY